MTTSAAGIRSSLSLVAFIGIIVGTGLMLGSALQTIDARLTDSDARSGLFVMLFFVGAAVALTALALSAAHLWSLVRRTGSCRDPLTWITLSIGLVLAVALLVIVVNGTTEG